MPTNGTNTMKCLVIGNSPSVSRDASMIDSYNYIIRNKLPDTQQKTGDKIDMFVSRTRKVNTVLQSPRLMSFKYKQIFCDPDTEPCPGEVLVYHDNIVKMSLDNIKEETGLRADEKPTIGLIAIFIGLQLFGKITLTGIEYEFNSEYVDTGHYDDIEYKRVNDHHNLYKEMIYIRKHIRENMIQPI